MSSLTSDGGVFARECPIAGDVRGGTFEGLRSVRFAALMS